LNGFRILTDKKISAKAYSFLYVYVHQLKLEGIDGALNEFFGSDHQYNSLGMGFNPFAMELIVH